MWNSFYKDFTRIVLSKHPMLQKSQNIHKFREQRKIFLDLPQQFRREMGTGGNLCSYELETDSQYWQYVAWSWLAWNQKSMNQIFNRNNALFQMT